MIDDDSIEAFVRDEGLLSEGELESAIEAQERSNRPLFDILVEEGYVDEAPLVEHAAEVLNVDRVDPSGFDPDPEILELLPAAEAVEHWVLPLGRESVDGEKRLVLAMRDPLDMQAMEAVADRVDIDVRPVLAGPRALQASIADAYGVDREAFERGEFDYTAGSRKGAEHDGNETRFGPTAISSSGSEIEPVEREDDADDSSIHAAETAQGELEGLAREAEERHGGGVPESGDEPTAPSQLPEESDGDDRLSALRDRLDLDETTGEADAEKHELIRRIAHADGGISDEDLEALQRHDLRAILEAGLVAAVDRGLLTIDDLVDALPDSE